MNRSAAISSQPIGSALRGGFVGACVALALGSPVWAQKSVSTPPTLNPVQLRAADGAPLMGFWLDAREDTGGPAALLLHNDGRDHYGWSPLWIGLRKVGCSILALDLRGHGASRKLAPATYERLVNHDTSIYQEMLLDAEAGIEFLVKQRGIRPDQIVVMGGELGCGIGFALMARNPKLRGMVALSPAANDYGYDALKLIQRFGKRPLLIVTSKQRLYDGPQAIHDALKDKTRVQLEIYPGADAKGVGVLDQPAHIERVIIDWLVSVFPSSPTASGAP
jgi:pimeloyl-ACP methyl ester carboxylesterase